MYIIETKYFSYCKPCRILLPSTKSGANRNHKTPNLMKHNTLHLTLTAIAASSLAMFAVTTIAVTVSYLAVAILVAVAAVDYRQGPKCYAAR